jgi:hypothetical protein
VLVAKSTNKFCCGLAADWVNAAIPAGHQLPDQIESKVGVVEKVGDPGYIGDGGGNLAMST